ncbi:MAG: M15 family metallopeptidase [Acidimicrobiales bacterium]
MRRTVTLLVIIALAAAGLSGSIEASADPEDTRNARDRVRAEKVAAAARVDALEATEAELSGALEVLETNVQSEEAKLREIERAVEAANAEASAALLSIQATSQRLARLRSDMAAQAVAAYIQPEGSSLSSVLEAGDASQAAQRHALRDVRSKVDADLTDRIRAAKAELEVKRRSATAAGDRAEAKAAEAKRRVAQVEAAKTQQQTLVDKAQTRIDRTIALALELERKDKELSARYLAEAAALQAQLAAAREEAAREEAAREEAAREADAARDAAARNAAAKAAAKASYSAGGRESAGPVATPVGPTRPGSSGGVSLCTVGGITVNCQISGQLGSLLTAAANAGLRLSGGGWRDPAQQIALRRAHCGSSYYAIYQMSPSSCRPPTARPGQSMHEIGLAIDFANCSSRSSACFGWLAGNASRFGFYNLPNEPWHWSVNGN